MGCILFIYFTVIQTFINNLFSNVLFLTYDKNNQCHIYKIGVQMTFRHSMYIAALDRIKQIHLCCLFNETDTH